MRAVAGICFHTGERDSTSATTLISGRTHQETPDTNMKGMDRAGNIVSLPGQFESPYAAPEDDGAKPEILIEASELDEVAEKAPAAIKRVIAFQKAEAEINKLEKRLSELEQYATQYSCLD